MSHILVIAQIWFLLNNIIFSQLHCTRVVNLPMTVTEVGRATMSSDTEGKKKIEDFL